MRTHVIPLLALALVQAGFLALVPLVVIAVGTRIINGVQDARLPWTPRVELAAFTAGAAAGAIAFGYGTDPSLLGPSAVFQVGGPWDMTFGEFVRNVANPFRYDMTVVLLSPAGIFILLVAAALVAAPIARFRSPVAVANGIRNAFLAVSGAYSAIYGLGYCLWVLNKLNFWVFLLLMIFIHLRSRTGRPALKLK